jgi:EAL domain-containing protein (putative c-di-GMP-specific phosphodiesterase class I)/ActR/RegA family two-component response regulator
MHEPRTAARRGSHRSAQREGTPVSALSDSLALHPAASQERSAWVVIGNAHEAWNVAQALQQSGWRLCGVATGVKGAHDLLRSSRQMPDLVVTGLHFDDGDGFQLIRLLAERPQRPAVFVASRQQRAVIKAATALAAACGVPSAGVAEKPEDADAIAQALRDFRPERRTPVVKAVAPQLGKDELLSLFDRGALVPWLQPKVRIDTHEVVGFEALMRAHDEAGQLIMPDRLVASLSTHGLLDQATMHMARQTVDFVGTCLSEGYAISASINVAMQSLANLGFCQELARAVEAIALDPSWITIEITETDAMSDLAQVIENTGRIRMLGFNIAIDDFGTAYSSFFQLSRIPFSELKIERAFTKGLHADAGNQAIVRACAQLGDSLGLHVVAEGVETAAELESVRRCGCSQIQGYLVSRPMPAQTAYEWLRGLDEMRFVLPG